MTFIVRFWCKHSAVDFSAPTRAVAEDILEQVATQTQVGRLIATVRVDGVVQGAVNTRTVRMARILEKEGADDAR